MKNRRRLFFVLLLLLCSPVVFCSGVFAADDVDNWYNSLQPFDVGMYHQTDDGILYMTAYTSDGAVFSNPAKTNVEFVASGFIDSSGGWLLSQIPQYDYYLNYIVCAYAESESDFSFYPNYYRVGYDVHGQFVPVSLEDVSFSHYDQSRFYGFSAVGRIPEGSYFGSPVRDISVTGSGSLPANIRVFVVMYQVPKDSDGTSADAAAIVSAIQNQTQSIVDSMQQQTDDLMGVPDEQVQAAEQFVNDSNAQLQEALSPLMAAEQLSGSLVNAFRSKEKYQVYFPGVAGPFMPDGSTVTIIQPQSVDMSFMDRFSIITDAIGVVMLGLCGWKTLDFLYNTLMKILGKEGDES